MPGRRPTIPIIQVYGALGNGILTEERIFGGNWARPSHGEPLTCGLANLLAQPPGMYPALSQRAGVLTAFSLGRRCPVGADEGIFV